MANQLDGSDKNRDMEKVLLDVIKVLQDGQKGFADIGEHLKDETLKKIAVWRVEGDTIDEIAAKLGCARRTVHRKLDLIKKLLLA